MGCFFSKVITTLKGHTSCVISIAFHPTLPHLVGTAGGDGTVKLWNHETQECIATLQGHTSFVTSIAFHPTLPHLVGTASGDGTAKLWNHETQKCIATLKGHTDYLWSIAFHPTLPHLVGTASRDRTAKLWNHETQECIATLEGHTDKVKSIAFHPTLPYLVGTASGDDTAKLWNHETQECIATLRGHRSCVCSYVCSIVGSLTVNSIAFHPTLPSLVGTASNDSTAKVHDISSTRPVHDFEQAYSAAHPLTIKTLAGETYTLEGWGSCKDLKVALCKAVGEQLGEPSSFELLADLGPPRVDAAALTAGATGGATGGSSHVQIDGKYGSIDRRKMVAPSIEFNFELSLMYTYTTSNRSITEI